MASAEGRPNDLGDWQPASPERQSSFVGLPLIRRASTFDGLLGKGEGDDNSVASFDKDVPPVPPVAQSMTSQIPNGQNTNPSVDIPKGQQQQFQQQQSQQQQFQQHPQHQPQQFMQQAPPQQYMNGQQPGGPGIDSGAGPYGFMAGRGYGGPGGPQPPQQFGFGRGGPGAAGPQFGQGPPGMPGQSFPPQTGGNPVHRLPPGWKLEESTLSEPLHQTNRNKSPLLPQPSHFAYDKETEPLPQAPVGAGLPQRRNNTGMPPISAVRWPTLFQESGQPGQLGQQGPPGPHEQFGAQGQAQQQLQQQQLQQQQQQQQQFDPHKAGLSRTSTNEVPEHDRNHTRNLSSGLFSKFSRGRSASVADDKSSVHVVGGDTASIVSTDREDSKEKKGFFGNLARRSTAALDQMGGPVRTPMQQQQQQQQADAPSLEHRRTFAPGGGDVQPQAKPKSSLSLMRTATSETLSGQVPPTSGKKRLSGFVDRLKGSGSKEHDQSVRPGHSPVGPGPEQGQGFTGPPNGQFAPQGQPAQGSQLPPGVRVPSGSQQQQASSGMQGMPGQGPQGSQTFAGPQGQQQSIQSLQSGQQLPPSQGPSPGVQGFRGPPGIQEGPSQGFQAGQVPNLQQQQFSSPRPMQPQNTGPEQNSDQAPQQRQFSGPGPLQPQITGQQQHGNQGHQYRQFSGPGPLQPQNTGPQPYGLLPPQQQQFSGPGPLQTQNTGPGQGGAQATHNRQFSGAGPIQPQGQSMGPQPTIPQQHAPPNFQQGFQSQGGQQGQPGSPQSNQFTTAHQGRPQSPMVTHPQGAVQSRPQNPQHGSGLTVQQPMSQAPLSQQHSGQQGALKSILRQPSENFGPPSADLQGSPGQQLRLGQQPPQNSQGQYRPQGSPGISGPPGQFGPPGSVGGPGGVIRPPTGGSTASAPPWGVATTIAAPNTVQPRKASGLLGGLLNRLKGGDSEPQASNSSQQAAQQGRDSPHFPGQERPPSQQRPPSQLGSKPLPGQQLSGPPGQPPFGQVQQRPAGIGAQTIQGGMGRGQPHPSPGQLQLGMRQTSQSSIGLPIQRNTPSPQPGQVTDDRPSLPSQQNSQTTVRPSGEFARQNPLGSNPVTPAAAHQRDDPLESAQIRTAQRISLRPSRERLSVIGVPGTPVRKPVGSGPSGPDRSSGASAYTVSTVTHSNSAVSRPGGSSTDGDAFDPRDQGRVSQEASSPAPSKPQFAEHNAPGLRRQPSMPTPSQTPNPQPPSPSAPSALSHAPSQASSRPSEVETASNAVADQHVPTNILPSQQPGNMNQGLPQTQPRPLGAPGHPQQQFMGQHPQHTGSPAPSQHDTSGTMSKLFGKKEKSPTPAQQFASGQPPDKKEKTSSKLLGAFRRVAKQGDQPVSMQQQQFNGPPSQGRGQVSPQMQMQGGRGQFPPQSQGGRGQGPPPGPFQGQPQMSGGRGQPPPLVHAGRGQMPQQVPPGPPQGFQQAQGGRGQPQQPGPNQWATSQQRTPSFAPGEQQYAPVPIPRGYETVHGYGQPNMMAPSTYSLGRQYSGPGPQQWNSQYGPPQQQPQVIPGPGQVADPPGGITGPPPQQQPHQPMHPTNLGQPPTANTPPSQSSSKSAPIGLQTPQVSQSVERDGLRDTDAASVHSQQGPPPAQVSQNPQIEQISRNPTPAQYRGAPPAQRSEGVLASEPGRYDESPTIAPQVAAPVAGNISPPAMDTASPPVGDNYAVSPPMPEDNFQSRTQHDPMAAHRINTAPNNIMQEQNVPLPASASTSAFSPINPATDRLPNPPPPNVSPPNEEVEQPRRVPPPAQHRLSDIRLMSSKSIEASEQTRRSSASPDQSNHAVQPQHGHSNLLAARAMNLQQQQQQQQHHGQQPVSTNGPQTPVQDQHPAVANGNPNMNINVARANGHKTDADDYYDATPRVKPPGLDQAAQQPVQSPVRQRHQVESPTLKRDKNNKLATAAAAGGSVGVLGAAGAAASVSDENLALRNATSSNGHDQGREAEEKQVVEEAYELPAVNDNAEDLLIMSATSYPGQEWNPYGAGEFGEYE
ncbi:hypothetical protein MN608_10335 [Microdochium nivale]|nr:hypothetical protein MN608_10335 [Microdochium nivale]